MISVERCVCGQAGCRKFWLVGIGAFVQGSGFTEADAIKIAKLLNGEDVLNLTELMETQKRLQAAMGNPTGHGEAGAKENLFQAIVEVVEAVRELNFKPWKRGTKLVDIKAFATEITDVMQFLANAALAMGITGEDLSNALRDKWQVNQQRIKDQEVTSS